MSATTCSGTGDTPVSLFSERPAACASRGCGTSGAGRKWQVQYVVGCRRYSVSSHSGYESADRDYRFARSLFCLFGGESFIKWMGRPGKRVIFSGPETLRGKRTVG